MCKIECRRSLTNPMFFVALLINIFFVGLSIKTELGNYRENIEYMMLLKESANPAIEINSIFRFWIGSETDSMGFILFYFLFPLLACFSYSWSYVDEKKGFMRNLVVRSRKRDYFIAKYIACFVSGGLTILIPLLVNLFFIAMFIPARMPEVSYEIYYGVFYESLGSLTFYTHPFLYIIFFLVLDFVFAGLFSCVGYAIGTVVEKKIASMVLPFMIVIFFHYARSFSFYKFYKEISPIYFLHPVAYENPADLKIIIIEGIFHFLFSAGLLYKKGIKKDVL